MKVAEYIRVLQRMPQDADVICGYEGVLECGYEAQVPQLVHRFSTEARPRVSVKFPFVSVDGHPYFDDEKP